MTVIPARPPLRGEIWFVRFPTDPADKQPRPVVVVSRNERNTHPKANTVLVIPLSTSTIKEVATHVYLTPGETGLDASVLKAEDVTVVRKESLIESRTRLRGLSDTRICELASKVKIAMNC
jgi:mRNA-degrading endonuclease toxin of MazEF toxin-antitoxin module